LIVSSVSAPSTAGTGTTISVTSTTKNQGGGLSGPSTTRFYLSTNSSLDSSDALLDGSRSVPALAPGAANSGSTSVTISPGTAPGTYYIIAKADADNAVPETNDGNNTKSSSSIKIGPDLIVSSVSAPSSAGAGSTISVTDSTRNQGGGSAGASTTKFYLSTNSSLGSSDIFLGSRAVGTLGPGETKSGSTPLTIPPGTASGTYRIVAQADGDNVVPETSNSNNTRASSSITIGP
jgi:subtilase family serine protease